MAELLISELRDKLEGDLDSAKNELTLAKEKVRLLEGQLQWFDNRMSDGAESALLGQVGKKDGKVKESSPSSLMSSSKQEGLGGAIRNLMENASGQFNVPGIAKALKQQYPDIGYDVLSKRGSQIASRLIKRKKIKLVAKGSGREPNTYIPSRFSK